MNVSSELRSCCSSFHVLRADGRVFGKCWYDQIGGGSRFRILGHGEFTVIRPSFWKSHVQLTRADDPEVLAWADPGSDLALHSRLQFDLGPATLERGTWFSRELVVRRQGRVVVSVDGTGTCDAGWLARHDGTLTPQELIFVGTIWRGLQASADPVVP